MSEPKKPVIAYLTAGAAGMFCGSCMHDNTLARSLIARGWDVALIPAYTPITTDEGDVSIDKVFFGGINVYLQQKIPLFRYLPKFMDNWINRPGLIRRLASGKMETDARFLGEMTLSVLRGEHGYQKKEVERLVSFLANDLKPDLLILTNVLVAGFVPALKRALDIPVLGTLQGDDLFIEDLSESYRESVKAQLGEIGNRHLDGFIVNSHYYADFMADYLRLDRTKFHIVPLGLDLTDFERLDTMPVSAGRPPRIGYLARIAPEKGLGHLVDAFLKLREKPGFEDVELHAAGWMGGKGESFLAEQQQKLASAGAAAAFTYHGTVDREQKLAFLKSVDIFSVPTTYREPKGLFLLEAVAAGLPYVMPAHGAFPEIHADLGGGELVPPGQPEALADSMAMLLTDHACRQGFAQAGHRAVFERRSAEHMASRTQTVLANFLQG